MLPELLNAYFLFPITAAGAVPCGGPKMSPRTSSKMQIIFLFRSYEISEGILRYQKIIIGLDIFSNQCSMYFCPFESYVFYIDCPV